MLKATDRVSYRQPEGTSYVIVERRSGHVPAAQRYIVSQPHVMRTVDIVRELRERFPGIVVPDGTKVSVTINIDSSKVCHGRVVL